MAIVVEGSHDAAFATGRRTDLSRPIGRRAGERPARIVVIDDHRSVAEALALAIGSQPDLECVGTAGTLAEGRRIVDELEPDVVLIDVVLPDGDGIEGAHDIGQRHPRTRVLVLTAHTDMAVLARAASAGACGFLPKESSIRDVLRALRAARDGGMIVDHATLTGVLSRLRTSRATPEGPSAADLFTARELDVLRGLASGGDPARISRDLGMSINTCRGHIKSILSKLGAHSQLEAVVIALRRGLLPDLLSG